MDYVMPSVLHHCYAGHHATTPDPCRVAAAQAGNLIVPTLAAALPLVLNADLPAVRQKYIANGSAGVLKKVNASRCLALILVVERDRFVGKDNVFIIKFYSLGIRAGFSGLE